MNNPKADEDRSDWLTHPHTEVWRKELANSLLDARRRLAEACMSTTDVKVMSAFMAVHHLEITLAILGKKD